MTNVVKKKVLRKDIPKKGEVKLPTRWIMHTIKDTLIEINELPNTALLRNEYYVGEWRRYENCTFIISLEDDPKTIYFDECIFTNCKFSRTKTTDDCDLNIIFTACDFDNVEFESMNKLITLSFTGCVVKNVTTAKENSNFIADQIIFSSCYTLSNVTLDNTILHDIRLLNNLNYDKVDLRKISVPEVIVRDKHLLKYWDNDIKFAPCQVIDYERITNI